jgi:hypothetical protein
MTDDEWEAIKPLAEAATRARNAYDWAGMMNTAGLDERRLVEQSVAYERLYLEMQQAERALSAAKQKLHSRVA